MQVQYRWRILYIHEVLSIHRAKDNWHFSSVAGCIFSKAPYYTLHLPYASNTKLLSTVNWHRSCLYVDAPAKLVWVVQISLLPLRPSPPPPNHHHHLQSSPLFPFGDSGVGVGKSPSCSNCPCSACFCRGSTPPPRATNAEVVTRGHTHSARSPMRSCFICALDSSSARGWLQVIVPSY